MAPSRRIFLERVSERGNPMKAVAQSGNKGAHLQPSTMRLPKQLMPVGSKQVLELPFK